MVMAYTNGTVSALKEGIDEVEDRRDSRGANVLIPVYRSGKIRPGRAQGRDHERVIRPSALLAGLAGEVGDTVLAGKILNHHIPYNPSAVSTFMLCLDKQRVGEISFFGPSENTSYPTSRQSIHI